MTTLKQYQEFCKSTDKYPGFNRFDCLIMGLASEAGEICGKRKKEFRDQENTTREDYAKEIGDCLWYITRMADVLGYSLEEIIDMNVDKLTKRKKENKISGSGDNR